MLASVALQARLASDGRSGDVPSVRVPRRSGGWLRLDASLMEDGQRVAVMISTAREPEVADLIAQVYGLTAREREVTRLTMQGLSTREMATALHVSPYTVQDHLKSVFEKAGVRSRRELTSRVYFDQYVPHMNGDLAPSGWFSAAIT